MGDGCGLPAVALLSAAVASLSPRWRAVRHPALPVVLEQPAIPDKRSPVRDEQGVRGPDAATDRARAGGCRGVGMESAGVRGQPKPGEAACARPLCRGHHATCLSLRYGLPCSERRHSDASCASSRHRGTWAAFTEPGAPEHAEAPEPSPTWSPLAVAAYGPQPSGPWIRYGRTGRTWGPALAPAVLFWPPRRSARLTGGRFRLVGVARPRRFAGLAGQVLVDLHPGLEG